MTVDTLPLECSGLIRNGRLINVSWTVYTVDSVSCTYFLWNTAHIHLRGKTREKRKLHNLYTFKKLHVTQ